MERITSGARYFAIVGVVFGLLASLTAFAWGALKSVLLVGKLVHGNLDGMAVGLVQVMDAFLIAAGLLIFAFGLYELFVGSLSLPKWLVIDSLDSLKSKLSGVVIMVMAVAFLERLESAETGRDVLYQGLGVAAVAAVLVALTAKIHSKQS